jgi:hypothetical protein
MPLTLVSAEASPRPLNEAGPFYLLRGKNATALPPGNRAIQTKVHAYRHERFTNIKQDSASFGQTGLFVNANFCSVRLRSLLHATPQ